MTAPSALVVVHLFAREGLLGASTREGAVDRAALDEAAEFRCSRRCNGLIDFEYRTSSLQAVVKN